MTQAPMTHLWFYSLRCKYGVFSNFYKAPFVIEGITYQTVEHHFQSQKFPNTEYQQRIINAVTPTDTKRLGRTRRYPIRADWESVKDDIMYNGVKAKFSQHPDLKKILLDTGDLIICEHTNNDKLWGDGLDLKWTPESNIGKNKLGIVLMNVRKDLI
uniref:NADAR domain-containing protein n=1 Tax=viral metagenome TaxID=1070528 RepID=A0A6C0LHS1_9ZZZZ